MMMVQEEEEVSPTCPAATCVVHTFISTYNWQTILFTL